MSLFSPVETRVVDELRTIDVDRITPVEALAALAALKSRLKKDTT